MSAGTLSYGRTLELFDYHPNRSNSEPNRLIEAKNDFTLLQMRLFFLIVHHLDSNLETPVKANENRSITIKNAKKLLGGPSKENMIQMVDGIKQKELKWLSEDGEFYDAITPFPRVKYEKGDITVTIFSDVLPYFLDLSKGFTQYGIKSALQLQSKYSTKLYRLLCRWRSTGIWKKVDVEDLKLDLGAEGYTWAMFKKRVLEKAQEEINELTDISFQYVIVKKKGNKVTHVDFLISDLKKQKNVNLTDGSVDVDETTKRAAEYCDQLGIYNEDIRKKIFTTHKGQFWKVIYEYNLSKNKISSPSGFVLTKLGLVPNKKDGSAQKVVEEKRETRLSIDNLKEVANGMGISLNEAAKKLGYKIDGDTVVKL